MSGFSRSDVEAFVQGIQADWKEYLVKSAEIRSWAEQLFEIYGKRDPSV